MLVLECADQTVSAHILSVNALTCCTTENFLLIVTPSAFTASTRSNPGTAGGGITMDLLLLGGTKTISTDLVRFSHRLLSRAHSSMSAISDGHESALHAGTIT